MEKQQHESGNSGFMFGFLLGMAAALLVVTKKGRRLLRTIVDQGVEKIGNLEGIVKDSLQIEEDYIDGDDYLVPSISDQEKKEHNSERKEGRDDEHDQTVLREHEEHTHEAKRAPESSPTPETNAVTKMKSATRRFFKGVKKRS